jgi:hypothetical protein
MSEPLRVGLVCEGPTDRIFLESAITSMLGARRFILKQLQPEESLPFGRVGTGWAGIYRWSEKTSARNDGRLRGDILFLTYDVLVFHLDADVAGKRYAEISAVRPNEELPCEEPCPPASATTDRLRTVLLDWLGESESPPQTVLCTPSKTLETWVLAALFPNDSAFVQHGECLTNPAGRLGQQPIGVRITKSRLDYEQRTDRFEAEWPRVAATLSEATRFQTDFLAVAAEARR